ncbi:/ / hypothetical protein / 152623:153720 Reverse [Candidatus Hepatoplasma crinochetorum]|uniref:DUF2179 domain-containing protein n=1 Tax=Candidatus Hepatoplasma crinochetorum TaxID=295596 RepID=A0A0G7ZNH1_9MOLU|nr:/ / hypothetical protein / 152623:153720 Reverse [Candidatus Hepatoplasma crinochetorum]
MNELFVATKANINKVTKNKKIKGIFIITLAAIALAFAVNLLVIEAGIISAGAAGIAQGISYTITAITGQNKEFTIIYYWIINLLINIPIIFFTYRIYGKKLLGYSLYVFFVTLAVSFSITYIPVVNEIEIIPVIDEANPNYELLNTFRTFILAFMAGIVYGVSLGIIFTKGATSLGLDPIVRYLSREKRLNIAKVLFFISIVNSIIWLSVQSYIVANQNNESINFITDVLFGPYIIGSVIFISLYSFIVSKIYSTKKIFLLEINSEKYKRISDKLNQINYHRGHTIEAVIGGFSKKTRGILKIIVNIEEIDDVINIAENIDTNCFIYATQIARVQTTKIVYWNPITHEDIDHKKRYSKEHYINKDKKDKK